MEQLKFTEHAKQLVLDGKAKGGNLPYNGVTVERLRTGLILSFTFEGKPVAQCDMPVEDGQILSVSGIDGQIEIYLS